MYIAYTLNLGNKRKEKKRGGGGWGSIPTEISSSPHKRNDALSIIFTMSCRLSALICANLDPLQNRKKSKNPFKNSTQLGKSAIFVVYSCFPSKLCLLQFHFQLQQITICHDSNAYCSNKAFQSVVFNSG